MNAQRKHSSQTVNDFFVKLQAIRLLHLITEQANGALKNVVRIKIN